MLKYTNNSQLQITGKTRLEVQIGQMKQFVDFTVVKKMNPSVIGGIELQEQFEFRLGRLEADATSTYLCNIEAKFGRKTNDDERLLRKMTVLKPMDGDGLRDVIIQNKSTFMADNRDIGCIYRVIFNLLRKLKCQIKESKWSIFYR